MQTITPPQLTAIHTLFSKNGVKEKEDKQSVIKEFTNNRTASSREMTKEEAESLISHLLGEKKVDPKCDKLRKKILSVAHEMSWKKYNGKVDMDRINNWCKLYGMYHKNLDLHTYEELVNLVTQFDKVYKDFIKKVEPC